MKKGFSLLLVLIFLLGTVVGSTETYSTNITAWFYNIKINLDGSSLALVRKPFVYNNHTYVSINEFAKFLGYDVHWDDKTKTMNLTSSVNNGLAVSTLKYELDRKNLEVNNLKLQLQQKDQQLAVFKDTSYDSTDSGYIRNILNDLEDYLDDSYYRHRNNARNMYFTYSLTQLSSGVIQVKMNGDFKRSTTYWSDRDKSAFKDFILDICKEIDRKLVEDIIVYVYDTDNYTCAYYTYIDSKNEITYSYEY